MKKLHSNSDGFTAIELLVFVVTLVLLVTLAGVNIRSLRAQNRDSQRKTDISATYYQLEAFYEKNSYYPETIDTTTLKGIDPASLKDSEGKTFNQTTGEYTYKPVGCAEAKCKSYVLSATLEKEAPFTKESLNK